MKIRKLVPIFILILLVPMVTWAFSWPNINFFRKAEPVQQVKQLNIVQKISAEEKFNTWQTGFDKKNLDLIKKNPQNLILSEAELNYMVGRILSESKNPPIQNLTINLNEGEIEITGYLLTPMKGDIDLKIKPIYKEGKLYPNITYSKFKRLRLPTSIANKILYSNLQPSIDKLYKDNNLKNLQIKLKENQLEISL